MKIIVLDIETTGFNHDKDCILEIGMVELDLLTGERKPLLDKIFREKHLQKRHRNAWIFKNNFMTLEEVRNAPKFEEVKEEIQAVFDKYSHVAAWNSAFDAGFLTSRALKLPEVLPCPMRASASWFGIPNRYGKPGKWAAVPEARKILFPEEKGYNELHRGFSDSMDEAQIIYELYKKNVIWNDIKQPFTI